MGKIVAKIMRDAKEARKMSDAGAGGGGESGASEFVGALSAFDTAQGGVSQALGAMQAETGMDVDTGMIGVPGLSYGSPDTGEGIGGTGLTPITPAVTPAVAETPKTPKAPAIERKRRRRSLLSQEEGGLAEDGAIQRRSILGR